MINVIKEIMSGKILAAVCVSFCLLMNSGCSSKSELTGNWATSDMTHNIYLVIDGSTATVIERIRVFLDRPPKVEKTLCFFSIEKGNFLLTTAGDRDRVLISGSYGIEGDTLIVSDDSSGLISGGKTLTFKRIKVVDMPPEVQKEI